VELTRKLARNLDPQRIRMDVAHVKDRLGAARRVVERAGEQGDKVRDALRRDLETISQVVQ
jgi:hypothetical protein